MEQPVVGVEPEVVVRRFRMSLTPHPTLPLLHIACPGILEPFDLPCPPGVDPLTATTEYFNDWLYRHPADPLPGQDTITEEGLSPDPTHCYTLVITGRGPARSCAIEPGWPVDDDTLAALFRNYPPISSTS